MSDLEERYGFAASVAELTDQQLVARFNREVGNRAWCNARMYFLSCLGDEIRKRDFDSTIVHSDSGGLKLSRRVRLIDVRLEFDSDS